VREAPLQLLYHVCVNVGTGAGPGFNSSTTHQQALTNSPFNNTCGENEVSPKVAIGGCGTQVPTTRGNEKWIQGNNTQQPSYSLSPSGLLCELYLRSNTMMQYQYNRKKKNATSITQNNKIYMVHPLPRATSTELCFLIYYVKTYSSIYSLSLQISLYSISPLPTHPASGLIFSPS
jgi:hypothetical protein